MFLKKNFKKDGGQGKEVGELVNTEIYVDL
jgi:hypothetical protein